MSKISQHMQKCPKCGKYFKVKIYDSYNVSLLWTPKEKVLNREIFTYKCPHCKSIHKILYPCLYHDMKKNFMIWYVPKHMREQMNVNKEAGLITSTLGKFSKYTLREENDDNSFIEKIRVLDNGLNDKVFELFKEITLMGILEDLPKAQMLYLVGFKDSNFIFEVLDNNLNRISAITVPMESYEEIYSMVSYLQEFQYKSNFEQINKSWLLENEILEKFEALLEENEEE